MCVWGGGGECPLRLLDPPIGVVLFSNLLAVAYPGFLILEDPLLFGNIFAQKLPEHE